MRATTAIVVCLGLVAGAAAHADVYRWVDARGEVHYSDRWVPGSERIKVDRGRASGERPAADAAPRGAGDQSPLRASNERVGDQFAQASAADAVRDDLAKKRSEQCEQAKERYRKSIEARRIFRKGASGEREYLTDAEADEYRLAARREMDESCGAAAP